MDLLREHFDLAIGTPDGITKLRELILKLGMQGKLSKENKEDEPVDLLIQRINLEKNKNQKNKKTNSAILESEHLYSIPNSWKWIRLNDFLDVRDGTHDTPKYFSTGIPLITSKNLYSGVLDFNNIKFISESDHNKISERSKVDKFDILFAMIGSIGNPVIVNTEREFSIKNVALLKYHNLSNYNVKFILYYLQLAQKDIKLKASGAVQSFVSLNFLRNYPFPLPSLNEQKRIVEKIDELMRLCDLLEKQRDSKIDLLSKINNSAIYKLIRAEDEISLEDATKFIYYKFEELYSTESNLSGLKKAILDMGISGRFKIASIGSIHKNKYPSIPKIEEPFILPENWTWTALDNLGETQTGTTPPKNNPEYYGDYIPFLGPGDIKEFKINYSNSGLSELGVEKARFIPANSILMVCIGGSIGKMAINDRDVTCNQQINTITPYEGVSLKYLSVVLQSDYFQSMILSNAGGSATPIINKGKWISIPIPLPPIETQKEIADKIDKLLKLCNSLEDSINQLSKKQVQILNSVLANI